MKKKLINRFWERWAMTPDNDIFASSVSDDKTVKDVIRWHKKVCDNDEKKYDYENDKGKEFHCTQKQWEYWNRKAIAEEKKKVGKWYDAMFFTTTNWGWYQ